MKENIKIPRLGWAISKFGVATRGAGAKIQHSASCKLFPRPIEYTCQVSPTSAQRSRSRRVLKMLTPHRRTDILPALQVISGKLTKRTEKFPCWDTTAKMYLQVEKTRGQTNLTKSASQGAHSPVRGHPRGSKFVPLNSWGRVSY